ncbi:MAG: flippase-like domain-containing protein [Acidobacteriaceae bacterium]|nr:flippase-like domain-containing protein [Acidobacteriaceae bacterium]
MIKKWDTPLVIVGLGLFAFAAGRIGWGAIIQAIEEAGTAVAIILGLSLVRLVLQTRSWSIALRVDGIGFSAGKLMLIRLASQGIGYLSVLGPVASEPMKISLLQRQGGSATTATLIDTGVYWFTSGVVALAGCFSAALLLAHHRHSIAPLATVGVLLTVGLFLLARPTSQLSLLADALGSRCPRWLEKGVQIEVALRQFGSQHPSQIRRMFLLDVACQVLLIGEIVAVFWCLKIPLHVGTILGVEGASRAIKIMASWMPARIGVDESGIAGAFFAFGLSPASGLTLALARRLRDLLAALIGLGWFAWSARFWKDSPAWISEANNSKEEKRTCSVY